jgi:hypothetical protein
VRVLWAYAAVIAVPDQVRDDGPGIQNLLIIRKYWIPAFAGMTCVGFISFLIRHLIHDTTPGAINKSFNRREPDTDVLSLSRRQRQHALLMRLRIFTIGPGGMVSTVQVERNLISVKGTLDLARFPGGEDVQGPVHI